MHVFLQHPCAARSAAQQSRCRRRRFDRLFALNKNTQGARRRQSGLTSEYPTFKRCCSREIQGSGEIRAHWRCANLVCALSAPGAWSCSSTLSADCANVEAGGGIVPNSIGIRGTAILRSGHGKFLAACRRDPTPETMIYRSATPISPTPVFFLLLRDALVQTAPPQKLSTVLESWMPASPSCIWRVPAWPNHRLLG